MRSVMGSGLVRAEVGQGVRGAGQQSGDARIIRLRTSGSHFIVSSHLDSHNFLLSMKEARFGEVRWQRRVGGARGERGGGGRGERRGEV